MADYSTWRNLAAVRAAFILIAWIIICIHSKADRLRIMIKDTEEKAFYEELQIDQQAAPLVSAVNSP